MPERERIRGAYIHRAILLDADLLGQAPDRDFRAHRLAEKLRITLIWQNPCHEAFLLRHFEDATTLRPATAADALSQLQRRWPEYQKASQAMDLRKRFDLTAIRRAMEVEPEFATFLAKLGLLP